MGLFQGKQQSKQEPSDDEMSSVLADEFREEIRDYGRKYFEKVINDNTTHLKQDLDDTIAQVHNELKEYATRRLDATLAQIDSKITERLDEQLAKQDKVVKEAQDASLESLNQNARTLHEKYQQLSHALQQTVASQEVAMISVFQENKSQLNAAQDAQNQALQSLHEGANDSKERQHQLSTSLQEAVTQQEQLMKGMFDETKARIDATKEVQGSALQSIGTSAKALQEQSQQLSATLSKSLADQKELMANAFQDNMARVIEHYLLETLGDQYDMKAQLPSIIEQMEANKQTIADDMKL